VLRFLRRQLNPFGPTACKPAWPFPGDREKTILPCVPTGYRQTSNRSFAARWAHLSLLHHGKRQRTGAVQNLAGFGRHVLVVAPASWTAPVLWRFWRRLARNRAAPPPANRPSWGGQGIQRDGGIRARNGCPNILATVLNRKPRKCPILGRLYPQWPLSRPFHPLPSSFDLGTTLV